MDRNQKRVMIGRQEESINRSEQDKQMLEWFNVVEPCDGRHDKSCSGWGVVISQWGDGFRATLFGERFLIGKRMRQEAGNENQTVFD